MQERFYISFGLGALLENSKTFLGGGTSDYFMWSVVPMTQPWLVLEKGWMDFNVSVSLNPCVFVCCLPNMLSGVWSLREGWEDFGVWSGRQRFSLKACYLWWKHRQCLELLEGVFFFLFFLYSEANSVPLLPDFGMSLTRSRLALVKRSNDAALTELWGLLVCFSHF